MTATKTSYSVTSITDAGPPAAEEGFGLGPAAGRRGAVSLRRDFGITSFGINAFYQGVNGEEVISEHTEGGEDASGHEELYIVLAGSATFTIDGDTVEAPQGTAIFIPAATKRAAVANDDDTTIVVVGGTPGEAWKLSAGEAMGDFFKLYREQDYAGALVEVRKGLETYPGNALILYNVGCLESLLGNQKEALAALEQSLPQADRFRELAGKDDDLIALRDNARFQELIA
ncbi:MAG TPA: cupin domain-containing protein [Gaiellaceae bacterium]